VLLVLVIRIIINHTHLALVGCATASRNEARNFKVFLASSDTLLVGLQQRLLEQAGILLLLLELLLDEELVLESAWGLPGFGLR
jgi:hypothetical protein